MKKIFSFFILVFAMFVGCLSIASAAAGEELTVIHQGTGTQYLQYIGSNGSPTVLPAGNYNIVETGEVAYCVNLGIANPSSTGEKCSVVSLSDYYNNPVVVKGLQIILEHGYPAETPSGLSAEQAKRATAVAIWSWLHETGADIGSGFYSDFNPASLSATGISGSQAVLTFTNQLLGYARGQQLLEHTVSLSPVTMTLSGGYFVGTTTVTLQNCRLGYKLDESALPTGYSIDGNTGNSGDVLTIKIPVGVANGDQSFSLTVIGNDDRALANMFMLVNDKPTQNLIFCGTHYDNIACTNQLTLKTPAIGRIQIMKQSTDPITPRVTPFPLKGAVFQVYLKSAGSYDNATADERDLITTDQSGNAITKYLTSGEYTVKEVQAAAGHAICEPFDVAISENGRTYNNTVNDLLVTGKVTIEKKGELLTGATTDEIAGEGHPSYFPQYAVNSLPGATRYVPKYEIGGLPNAVFDIVARKDIITPDGILRAAAGTVVDTVTTGADGTIESKLLYLGDYYAVETQAPSGMVLDPQERDFSLVYKDQTTPIVFSQLGVMDQRQKAEVSLFKDCEPPIFNRPGFNLYANIVFGLYARADILAYNEKSVAIPKDGLLEYVQVDVNGKATIKTDLPFGSYYLKEVKTAAYNVINPTEYDFSFTYDVNKGAIVTIPVNDSNGIENHLQKISPNKYDTLVTWRDNKIVPGGTFSNGMTYVAIDVEKARTEGYEFGIADSSPSNNYIGYNYYVKVDGNDLVIYFDDCLISASVSASVYGEPFTKADPSHHTTITNGQELRLPLPAVTDNNNSGGGGVTAVIEGNGNQRTLTITVDGVKYPNQPWSNNGSSTYELGGYKFNVAVQGNKVNDITILESPVTPSNPNPYTQQIVYLFFHLEKGITHYDTWLK